MKLFIYSILFATLLSGCHSKVRYDLIGPQSIDLEQQTEKTVNQ